MISWAGYCGRSATGRGHQPECSRRWTQSPSLEWLEPLARTDFGHFDLARFGVTPDKKVNRKLAFSLIARPSPFEPKPWMTLVSGGSGGRPWDNVMWNIARWLIRHLDDPNLLLWLVKQGGQLHSELIEHIRRTMDGLAKLESAGKTEKLEDIRAKAPNAIPRPAMRKLWDLVLTGRAKSAEDDRGLYQWRERFSRDGLTTSLRLELREKLTPRVALSEPFDWPTDDRRGGRRRQNQKSRRTENRAVRTIRSLGLAGATPKRGLEKGARGLTTRLQRVAGGRARSNARSGRDRRDRTTCPMCINRQSVSTRRTTHCRTGQP